MQDITPEQSAKELIEINFPIEKYEKLQSRRNERLKYWNEQGLQVLINNEKELVEYGEKVLTLLKRNHLIQDVVNAKENHNHIADTGFAEAVEGLYTHYLNCVIICLKNGITADELKERGIDVEDLI